MYERYSGSFLSVSGVEWKAMILQEADSEFAPGGGLTFVSGSEIEIEWPRKDKEEVVCGSVATVTLLSPGDRTYADLYTVTPGAVRLDIYREGSLYWSGLLDPEFYEEPYAYGSGYAVTLTFSDFGIFERLRYNLTGRRTIREVIKDALSRSGLPYFSVNDERVSLIVPGYAATPALDAISVRSENWTDEDGSTASLMEVLKGMMQPLGLKIAQKAGTVYVYDINGLYNTWPHEEIVWGGTNQRLGVDKVANNVRVLFSPYADGTLTSAGDVVDTSGDSEDDINLKDYASLDEKNCFTYYKGLSSGVADPNSLSFTIFIHKEGNLPYVHRNAGYFHILPLLDGEESAGVVNWFYSGSDKISGSQSRRQPSTLVIPDNDTVFRTERIFLPDLSQSGGRKPLLRIRMEMMMDVRYNPFESEDVEGDRAEIFRNCVRYVGIPVVIRLCDESGADILYYSNFSARNSTSGTVSLASTMGDWKPGAATTSAAKLYYYDLSGGEAAGGWKSNRQAVWLKDGNEYLPSFKGLDSGQYIPYPTGGGYLEVSVLGGIEIGLINNPFDSQMTDSEAIGRIKAWIRWMLYKAPVVELINNNVTHSLVSSDDVEYTGVINADAKDGIEIDTVCGTMDGGNPTARGLYYNPDGIIVGSLTRGGRTERPEQLLIGTLYSQYADRKTVLSGTARLCRNGLRWYSDAAQEDKEFMLLSEVQNLREDESVIEAAEFRPDEYKSNKE